MRKQLKPKDLVILAGVTNPHSFEAPPLSGLFGWVTRDVSVAGLPHYQHLVEVSQSPWLSQQTSTEIFSQIAPFVLLKTKVSKNASNTGWISRCWAKRCGGREQSYKWLNGPRELHIICVCLKMGGHLCNNKSLSFSRKQMEHVWLAPSWWPLFEVVPSNKSGNNACKLSDRTVQTVGVNGSPLCWTNKRHNWPLLKAQPPFPLSFRKRPLSVDAAALMDYIYNKTGQWQIDKISNCLSTNQSLEVSRRRGNPNSVSLALTGVLFREYAQNYTTLIWRPKIWAGVKHAPDLTLKKNTHFSPGISRRVPDGFELEDHHSVFGHGS